MEFKPGNLVYSTAGRDRGHLFMVIAITQDRVLVADGRRRGIRQPKPKNPLHLRLAQSPKQTEVEIETDADIRKRLQEFLVESQNGKRGGTADVETRCH